MFILTTITDLIQITPEQFEVPSFEALEDNINGKYADKVIHKVGLCICLYDILSTSDGHIGHGTGVANVNVTFRLIVFRPFKGEILEGTIGHSDPDGIRVHVHFYTDIVVPRGNLFDNTRYDKTEGVHIWNPNQPSTQDDDHLLLSGAKAQQQQQAGDDQGLYFDVGETVRFRIESEVWTDKAAGGPTPSAEVLERLKATSLGSTSPAATKGAAGAKGGAPAAPLGADALAEQRRDKRELERKRSPYGIVASMALSGLGPVVWWPEEEEPPEGAALGAGGMEGVEGAEVGGAGAVGGAEEVYAEGEEYAEGGEEYAEGGEEYAEGGEEYAEGGEEYAEGAEGYAEGAEGYAEGDGEEYAEYGEGEYAEEGEGVDGDVKMEG